MAFPPSFLDELRNRLSIASVVGRRVRLVKRGREHTGLCPFHNEKSPSFTVSEDKGFFHCFGCGAHGDVIGFVMRSEGLAFPEAVERLAGEAGLQVPMLDPRERQQAERATTLGGVMEAATSWYESQLHASAGQTARRYIEGRGLTAETIGRFRLGFAANSRTALKEALLARDFPEALQVEAGLLIKPDDGGPTYDRFRDRVMFPIGDRRGRIIAFGGRALGEAPAKYLNSPETPLFHKGRTLYNLAIAREASREAGTVIVCEGYMDVIALAQAGFAHAVAPLGTALTEEQMAELWRLTAEPILCFDGDSAGMRAALRAAERCLPLLQPGKSFRFALLPGGQDPDDLIRAQGAQAMADVLAAAQPLSEMLWRKETADRALDTPERRAALEQSLTELTGQIKDSSVQAYYRQHFRDRLRLAFQARRPERAPFQPGQGRKSWQPPAAPTSGQPVPLAPSNRREAGLVVAILNHPYLLEGQEEAFAGLDLTSPDLDRLRGAILEVAARVQDLDSDSLKRHLSSHGHAPPAGPVGRPRGLDPGPVRTSRGVGRGSGNRLETRPGAAPARGRPEDRVARG